MIEHTLIFAFDEQLPESELDQFLTDMTDVLTGAGHGVDAIVTRRNIRTANDAHAPQFPASAVARMTYPDLDALEAASADAELVGFITREQSRHPYKVVWANHEPFA